MARHASRSEKREEFIREGLDYHEGLSANQVEIVLREFGFNDKHLVEFNEWIFGRTCPILKRDDRQRGGYKTEVGIYEYDLFQWIAIKKTAQN